MTETETSCTNQERMREWLRRSGVDMSLEGWNTSGALAEMLPVLYRSGRATDRRLRLFVVACCRHVWNALEDDSLRAGVEMAERFADGDATPDQLEAARAHLPVLPERPLLARRRHLRRDGILVVWGALAATMDVAGARSAALRAAHTRGPRYVLWGLLQPLFQPHAEPFAGELSELVYQRHLLRDISGNPLWPPPAVAPSVLTPEVLALAHAAYQNRTLPEGTLEPARLGALADALEAAGCIDSEVLAHLRSAGPHTRGCWALDLLLNKS